MPHDAAACRVFTLESEGARVGIQTHNAGVAGSSPAPAIKNERAQLLIASAVSGLRAFVRSVIGGRCATTGATKGPKNWLFAAPALPTAYIPRETDRPAAPSWSTTLAGWK